jgi:UDP-2,4-diacetamido-2,4,6-trideoxy-beta-L-altropyranose hydrolase
MSSVSPDPILIRADANPEIGAGHVMRCLAIAQAWQARGGRVAYAMATAPEAIRARLQAEAVTTHALDAPPGTPADADQTLAVAQTLGAPWIIVDGYRFDSAYLQRFYAAGRRVLVIDDDAQLDSYPVDLILNPNLHATESMYPAPRRRTSTRVCTGWEYALFRREFLQCRPRTRTLEAPLRRLLLTFGGSDPYNVSGRVLDALRHMAAADLHVRVLAGGMNLRLQTLRAQAERFPGQVEILHDVTNMPGLMNWADLAVSAAGGTADELLFLNVPFLAVIVADNQAPVAEAGERMGLFPSLGWHDQLTETGIADAIGRYRADTPRLRREAERRQALRTRHAATDWLSSLV